MLRQFYDFKPVKYSTIEIAYTPDLQIDCYYIQMCRYDYPCNVYIKLDKDFKIKEFYPVYIGSMKNSIDIIKNKIRYLGHFDYRHYAYMSWDMINDPTEIYLPKKECIEKYKEDKLDAKYYTINDLSDIKNHKIISSKIKKFIKAENPDVFMYVTKNGELKRFCNIFNIMNDKYSEKHNQITAFDDVWL